MNILFSIIKICRKNHNILITSPNNTRLIVVYMFTTLFFQYLMEQSFNKTRFFTISNNLKWDYSNGIACMIHVTLLCTVCILIALMNKKPFFHAWMQHLVQSSLINQKTSIPPHSHFRFQCTHNGYKYCFIFFSSL